MDSIIFLATAIGASLTLVLVFSGTVFSIKWKYGVTVRHSTNKEDEKERIRGVGSVIRSRPRTQTLKINRNELINKKSQHL